MSISIRKVEQYDAKLLQEMMDRNLGEVGEFISTKHLRRESVDSFEKRVETIRFAAFDGDKIIGLSWGAAETPSRFIMHVSLVEKEYRRRGLYSKMLDAMLEATSEYDEVESHHHIFNNDIIALKLKRGFRIVGIDQTILIGPRVILRFFHNAELFDLMKERVCLSKKS